MKDKNHVTVGFIGQGYIGKSYADDFESRGFSVVRYAKEEPYKDNVSKIQEADVVFIAVPTPTTPQGFDDSIVRSVLPHVGEGKIAVIKSTLLPGTTMKLQEEFPHLILMHSPEFLSEKSAREDARSPRRNIIGIPQDTALYTTAAQQVLAILPTAPYELICSATEAELIKYANNAFFYTKIIFMNTLYDLAHAKGCSWEHIRDAMMHEPWIGTMHLDPLHKSGRGAGGACFIKDFAAFREVYSAVCAHDEVGIAWLRATEKKNIALLTSTGKDGDLLKGVYGENV